MSAIRWEAAAHEARCAGIGNVMANDVKSLPSPTLSEAMHLYLQLRGVGKAKTFYQAAMRNVGVVVDVVSDKPIAEYSTIDAGKVRDAMIAKGLAVLSVKRTFITIKAIINLAIAEHGLDIRNPFSSIFMPEAISKKRVSIPVGTIREIQQACFNIDDDRRWLIALISDTGMRLAEAAGPHMDDLCLDEDIPYVDISIIVKPRTLSSQSPQFTRISLLILSDKEPNC